MSRLCEKCHAHLLKKAKPNQRSRQRNLIPYVRLFSSCKCLEVTFLFPREHRYGLSAWSFC